MHFGPYESMVEIGRGGLGMVFRCRGPDGIDVAVKVLRAANSDQVVRFERERRLLAELGEQDGFVGLIDAGNSSAGPWIAMPFCQGGTLRARIAQGPLSIDGTVALGIQLASALGRAHAHGIVHRDMKPENVLFKVPGGPPLVADLGLAKHFDRGQPGATQSVVVTLQGAMLGTAGYMSPEQGGGAEAAGPPADVFALGAILHECLTGRPVYKSDNLLMLLTKVMGGDREPLDRPGVAPWLEAAIEKALSADPDERFADGQEFAEVLRLGPRGLTVAVPAPEQRPVERKRRVFPPLVAGGIVLAASAGAAIALLGRAPKNEGVRDASPPAMVHSKSRPSIPELPPGLRLGPKIRLWDGTEVSTYLWKLPGSAGDIELVHVPSGDFVMGSDDAEAYEWEKPQHIHSMPREYWIGRTDVTWSQYLTFCHDTGRTEPDKPFWWDRAPGTKEDHPVVMVSWEDAKAYCDWAHVSLPAEAEWEKAARGETGRNYPWGFVQALGQRCNFADASCPLKELELEGIRASDYFSQQGWKWDRDHSDGYAYTSPVTAFPRGASCVGALDMAGNVWQMCEDWYAPSYTQTAAELADARRTDRVLRGGSWRAPLRACRCSSRTRAEPLKRRPDTGFRPVLRRASGGFNLEKE